MDQYVEKSVLSATKVIEEQLDAEIEKLERLDEDDLEKIRRKRIQQVRTKLCFHGNVIPLPFVDETSSCSEARMD